MDEPQDFVLCVTSKGEEQRDIDHYERVDGWLRAIPVVSDSERIEWVIGDLRPHIFCEHGEEMGAYTGDPCPNCGRVRMLKIGVCDKCYWDLSTGTYATTARERHADTGRAEP